MCRRSVRDGQCPWGSAEAYRLEQFDANLLADVCVRLHVMIGLLDDVVVNTAHRHDVSSIPFGSRKNFDRCQTNGALVLHQRIDVVAALPFEHFFYGES